MLVRLLKDRLDPNQTAALAQLSRAQPSILEELRGWVGEERVVAALCDVVDFLMKKAMFSMFG